MSTSYDWISDSFASNTYTLTVDRTTAKTQTGIETFCYGTVSGVSYNWRVMTTDATVTSTVTCSCVPSGTPTSATLYVTPAAVETYTEAADSYFTCNGAGNTLTDCTLVNGVDYTDVKSPITATTGATSVTINVDKAEVLASASYRYKCLTASSQAFYSNSFTIEVVDRCQFDVIDLSTEGVGSTEDMADSYKTVSSIPRLVVAQTTGETLSADVTARFTHNDTTCLISNYRISHVIDSSGSNLTDQDIIERYSISISGKFNAFASTNITNDQIYIEAYNGFVWGGASTNYLIDYSFAAAYEPTVPETKKIEKTVDLLAQEGKKKVTQVIESIDALNVKSFTFTSGAKFMTVE